MKEPQCPAQDVNAAESASSTTGTSQESGQTEPLAVGRVAPIQITQSFQPSPHQMVDSPADSLKDVTKALHELIDLQRENNSLLLALIEALGEDPDPEELHIPRPL